MGYAEPRTETILTKACPASVAHTATLVRGYPFQITSHDYPFVCTEHDIQVGVQEFLFKGAGRESSRVEPCEVQLEVKTDAVAVPPPALSLR